MIILDMFNIISITETFQLNIQPVLDILICVHYLKYFLERGDVSEEIQATKKNHCSYSISSIFEV